MWVRNLWAYVLGYLVLTVQGEWPERFINLALTRGIPFWDIVQVNDQLLLVKVYARDFRVLRYVARRARCRLRIQAKRGLPFLFWRLRGRQMLVGGAVVFCLILYFLSSFIWTVEVTGTRKISPALVREVAAKAGLRPGTPKFQIRSQSVAQYLLQQLPGLAYAGIEVKGTRARIQIVEKVVPEKSLGPSHLVAKKAGMIKDFLVLSGVPLVKEGDVVQEGQILVSGIVTTPPPQENVEQFPGPPSEPRFVEARGIVRARVWYRCYGEAAREEVQVRKTGRVVKIVCIKLERKEIIIRGPRRIPYSLYHLKIQRRKFPRWRNITLPVEFVTIKAEEIKRIRVHRGYQEALKIAVQHAQAQLTRLLPAHVPLAKRQLRVLQGGAEDLVRVVVTAEVVEDIGEPKAFQPLKNLREVKKGGRKKVW